MTDHAKTFTVDAKPLISFGQGFPDIAFTDVVVDLGSHSGFIDYEPYSNPGWRTQIKKGTNATTHMFGRTVKYTSNSCKFRVELTQPQLDGSVAKWNMETHGDLGVVLITPSDPTGISIGEADNLAAEKLQQKILSKQRQFQTGVALGELKETVQLLTNPLRGIFELTVDYLNSVKKTARRKRRSKRDMKEMVSEHWLEYSFGIIPLISDVQGAARAVANVIGYRLPREVVNAKGESLPSLVQRRIVDNHGPWQLIVLAEDRQHAEVRYKASVNVTNNTPRDALDTFGLSFGNFAPTIWELIPFSFLVDYFTNCGTVIDSLAVNQAGVGWILRSQKVSSSSYVTSATTVTNSPWPPASWNGGFTAQSPGNNASLEIADFDRSSYGGLPTPTLRFKLPFGSPVKNANLVALGVLHRDALGAIGANLR